MKLREWKEAFIEAGIIIALLFLFCWPVKIDGISMEHTFQDKNRVFISRASKYIDDIEKGDIIVFSETLEGKDKKCRRGQFSLYDQHDGRNPLCQLVDRTV